jgi:nitrogen PTS system EIIA component
MSDGSTPSGTQVPPPEAGSGESAGLMDLLLPGAVLSRVSAPTKKQALQMLCEALAEHVGLEGRMVYEAVLLREKLAGTGAGDGVAIPHARVPGLSRAVAGFARFDPPHDFEAMDARPADLVFVLLAPEDRGGDHLKALARIARFMRRAEIRDKLRNARGVDHLVTLFSAGTPRSDAAA